MGATNMQNNPYVPWPSKILDVIKHTQKEYTFRMEYVGEVKPGQFFEVSIPKYGEAPISVSGIGPASQMKFLKNTKARVFCSEALTATDLTLPCMRTAK